MATARMKGIRSLLIQSRFLYPARDAVVCVSEGLREDLTGRWGVLRSRTQVIYNPVDIEHVRSLARETVDHPWYQEGKPVLIACGRLDPQKNYPLLLRAFARVQTRVPDVKLLVLGDGMLRTELVSLADALGVSRSVEFPGFQKNPFKYIARSKALILSSDMEGFPMVLIEAMACSTPVVATRCPSGPDEIITDGKNGFLVPMRDEVRLADAVIRILQDEKLRAELADEGRRSVEGLRAERVTRQYEDIFSSCDGDAPARTGARNDPAIP
jgi:glycosyltransferase involved in cell wall biosynthesis